MISHTRKIRFLPSLASLIFLGLAAATTLATLSPSLAASKTAGTARHLLAVVKGPYQSGNYEEARRKFTILVGKVPKDLQDNVLLYLGKTHYYLGNDEKAINIFMAIAKKFSRGDVAAKNGGLTSTLALIMEQLAGNPLEFKGKRWSPRNNDKGEPLWKVNFEPQEGQPFQKINFRRLLLYGDALTTIDPKGLEGAKGRQIMDTYFQLPITVHFVDEKSTSDEGSYANNWRTTLLEPEAKQFSQIVCAYIFENWSSMGLGSVLKLTNNVINGIDHFEASGVFTLAALFEAVEYNPYTESFGAPADEEPAAAKPRPLEPTF